MFGSWLFFTTHALKLGAPKQHIMYVCTPPRRELYTTSLHRTEGHLPCGLRTPRPSIYTRYTHIYFFVTMNKAAHPSYHTLTLLSKVSSMLKFVPESPTRDNSILLPYCETVEDMHPPISLASTYYKVSYKKRIPSSAYIVQHYFGARYLCSC